MSLINTPKASKTTRIMDQLLSESLFPEGSVNVSKGSSVEGAENSKLSAKKDPLASQVWRMYTKAKDTLPNGSRMENLTWRMMAMALTKQRLAELENVKHENSSMDIDDNIQPSAEESHPTTPPVADDTTGLLSSSAPPYTMNDFFKENKSQENPNVLVSGSSRAVIDQTPVYKAAKRRVRPPSFIANNSITIPSLDEDEDIGHQYSREDPYGIQSHSVPSTSYFMDGSSGSNVNNNSYEGISPLQHYPSATASSVLQHQKDPYQTPSPMENSPFYFGMHPMPDPTISPLGLEPHRHSSLPQENRSFTTNPGGLSFEEILSVYYNNNNNSNNNSSSSNTIGQHLMNGPESPGLLNIQSLHLSATDSPSPPFIPSSHSVSSSDYHSHDEDEMYDEGEDPLPSPASKYKKMRTSENQGSLKSSASASKSQCSNCRTTTTPLWRRDPQGHPLCNACGLFLKLHGSVRPLSLKTDVIKKRNRNSSAITNAKITTNDKLKTVGKQQRPSERSASFSIPPKNESRHHHQGRTNVYIAPNQQPMRPIIPARSPSSKRQSGSTSPLMTATHSSAGSRSPLFGGAPVPKTSSTTEAATNAAVHAILESIGIHLDSLPVELLPLIASAANYHAVNRQRETQKEGPLVMNLLGQQQQQQNGVTPLSPDLLQHLIQQKSANAYSNDDQNAS
ncbi:hypothetical protein K501DRAFT_281662 [Backusella circina FSU 941]|nr:hypothetical protein K501DRAFT_281662 [Backusella circina FSU 941]